MYLKTYFQYIQNIETSFKCTLTSTWQLYSYSKLPVARRVNTKKAIHKNNNAGDQYLKLKRYVHFHREIRIQKSINKYLHYVISSINFDPWQQNTRRCPLLSRMLNSHWTSVVTSQHTKQPYQVKEIKQTLCNVWHNGYLVFQDVK